MESVENYGAFNFEGTLNRSGSRGKRTLFAGHSVSPTVSDALLTTYTDGKIVTGPSRMSFNAMTGLVKSSVSFNPSLEVGRSIFRKKYRRQWP
jgi:hypothetical protein